jgi:hypothetical protein
VMGGGKRENVSLESSTPDEWGKSFGIFRVTTVPNTFDRESF